MQERPIQPQINRASVVIIAPPGRLRDGLSVLLRARNEIALVGEADDIPRRNKSESQAQAYKRNALSPLLGKRDSGVRLSHSHAAAFSLNSPASIHNRRQSALSHNPRRTASSASNIAR